MRWVKVFSSLGYCSVCNGPTEAALLRCHRHAQPGLASHWCLSILRMHRHSLRLHLRCSCPCCQTTAAQRDSFRRQRSGGLYVCAAAAPERAALSLKLASRMALQAIIVSGLRKPCMLSDMSGGHTFAASRGPDELLKPARQAYTNMHPVHSLNGARARRMALCSAPAVCPP